MRLSKKFIVIGVLAVVLVAGTIGGVAYAQTGSDGSQSSTLLARVAQILGIDQQKVEDAFTQAQSEIRSEALGNYLKKLVDEGKLTQEQADQYKTWVESQPDLSQYRQQLRDWQQSRPDVPAEFKNWQEAQPDVPMMGRFGGGNFRGGRSGFMPCR